MFLQQLYFYVFSLSLQAVCGIFGNSQWIWAVGAGIFGALGLLTFNSMVAKATPQTIGTFIVLMIVAQIVVPAIYQAIMSGGLPFSKIVGFVLAAVAAVLLLK